MSEVYEWSTFLELRGFYARWEGCGCTDRDLRDFQLELAADPLRWPVVPTAGGWRKARFVPPSWKKGKSGGLRVYFAILSGHGTFLLATPFRKSVMDDLPANEKRTMAAILARIRQRYEGG